MSRCGAGHPNCGPTPRRCGPSPGLWGVMPARWGVMSTRWGVSIWDTARLPTDCWCLPSDPARLPTNCWSLPSNPPSLPSKSWCLPIDHSCLPIGILRQNTAKVSQNRKRVSHFGTPRPRTARCEVPAHPIPDSQPALRSPRPPALSPRGMSRRRSIATWSESPPGHEVSRGQSYSDPSPRGPGEMRHRVTRFFYGCHNG